MRITSSEQDGVTVLSIEGVIKVGESAQEFTSRLADLLSSGSGPVLLDLSTIDYVDSTGLGELVGHLQRFDEAGRRLALLNPQERILALLRLTRLDEIFQIFSSRDEAIARLGRD
jgi:anti-sigma B factor antagonist